MFLTSASSKGDNAAEADRRIQGDKHNRALLELLYFPDYKSHFFHSLAGFVTYTQVPMYILKC